MGLPEPRVPSRRANWLVKSEISLSECLSITSHERGFKIVDDAKIWRNQEKTNNCILRMFPRFFLRFLQVFQISQVFPGFLPKFPRIPPSFLSCFPCFFFFLGFSKRAP